MKSAARLTVIPIKAVVTTTWIQDHDGYKDTGIFYSLFHAVCSTEKGNYFKQFFLALKTKGTLKNTLYRTRHTIFNKGWWWWWRTSQYNTIFFLMIYLSAILSQEPHFCPGWGVCQGWGAGIRILTRSSSGCLQTAFGPSVNYQFRFHPPVQILIYVWDNFHWIKMISQGTDWRWVLGYWTWVGEGSCWVAEGCHKGEVTQVNMLC